MERKETIGKNEKVRKLVIHSHPVSTDSHALQVVCLSCEKQLSSLRHKYGAEWEQFWAEFINIESYHANGHNEKSIKHTLPHICAACGTVFTVARSRNEHFRDSCKNKKFGKLRKKLPAFPEQLVSEYNSEKRQKGMKERSENNKRIKLESSQKSKKTPSRPGDRESMDTGDESPLNKKI